MKWKQSDYSCIIYVGYCSQAIHRLSLITQITEAYNNSSSIPIDKLSFTFGIPLTLQLEQNINIMAAWLLQFQAGQKRLANILKQERRNQGKITKFLLDRKSTRLNSSHVD